jgi:hypothetical protein
MDSRKCQTVTATPAKPGELPVGLEKYAHPQFTRDCYCITCQDGAKNAVGELSSASG